MYSRDYQGKSLRFEPSGGLVNSSLVMQDKETDTYWAIMEGKAVAGEMAGEPLVELPVGEKIQWRHWKKRHPDTLVLSVDGREDGPEAYGRYFRSPEGFGGARAKDDRLETKEPIFAFRHGDTPYAVPQADAVEGKTFELPDGRHVLLYRRKGASMFQSTAAFVSDEGFEQRDDAWIEKKTGARLDTREGDFEGGDVEPLTGFDTFWYTWSLNNPETHLIE